MAIKKHAIKGNGLTQLRSSRSSSDGTTLTETESWTGAYAELKLKQDAVIARVKGTTLEPTEADHGRLTIVRESVVPSDGSIESGPFEIITEVLWQELRKPVESHPIFAELSDALIKSAKDKAASDGPAEAPDDELAAKLYSKLVRGNTEYSTGVPLVRRTTTKISGNLTAGNAWFRDTPPVVPPGGWEFLKTADERRRDGTAFNQVEEWTGANEWDPDLYPAAP